MHPNLKGLNDKSHALELQKLALDEINKYVEDTCTKFLERFENSIFISYVNGSIRYLFKRCELDMSLLERCVGTVLREQFRMYGGPVYIEYHDSRWDILVKSKSYNFEAQDKYFVEDLLVRSLNLYMEKES